MEPTYPDEYRTLLRLKSEIDYNIICLNMHENFSSLSNFLTLPEKKLSLINIKEAYNKTLKYALEAEEFCNNSGKKPPKEISDIIKNSTKIYTTLTDKLNQKK